MDKTSLLFLLIMPLISFAYKLYVRIKADEGELPSYSKSVNESILSHGIDIEHGMSIGDGHSVKAEHKKSTYYQPH